MATRTTIIGGLLLSLALLAPLGCHSFTDYCTKAMDCEGGNSRDVDACLVQIELEQDRADTYGCTEWFDELTACVESESRCEQVNNYTFGNSCDKEQEHFGACMGDGLHLY